MEGFELKELAYGDYIRNYKGQKQCKPVVDGYNKKTKTIKVWVKIYGKSQISKKESLKMVMELAWDLAKLGAKKFGGNVKSYLSESLKMAWVALRERYTVAA